MNVITEKRTKHHAWINLNVDNIVCIYWNVFQNYTLDRGLNNSQYTVQYTEYAAPVWHSGLNNNNNNNNNYYYYYYYYL